MNIDQKFGICLKDQNKNVFHQNEICLKYCGNKLNQTCRMGCMENYNNEGPLIINKGMTLVKNVNVNNQAQDSVIINDGTTITTIFYPLEDKEHEIEYRLNELKKYDLTHSELDVLSMALKGFKRKEIAQKLFVSIATIKTHMNNIYKKLPKDWQHLKNR